MMEVNIWSDIRCPFCFIGKRKFEKALDQFSHNEEVNVVWKSFELDPTIETNSSVNIYEYFAEVKGIEREQAVQMFDNVTQLAKEVGLNFNLDNSVIANSFNAHRLIQLAKTKDLGNEIEEELFRIHFEEGANIDDTETLTKAAVAIGLAEAEAREVLSTNAFEDAVKQDQLQAEQIGVRGVPFFAFNNKYAISGAQSPETFLEILETAWSEFEQERPLVTILGDRCATDGDCN